MIQTGSFDEKVVTLRCDSDPKTEFTIKQLNFAAMDAIDRDQGAPPSKVYATTPVRLQHDDKLNKDVEVYDFTGLDDNSLYQVIAFNTKRDLAIVKQGLIAVNGKKFTPDQVVEWLNSIKPAHLTAKVVRELSEQIWGFSSEDPKD